MFKKICGLFLSVTMLVTAASAAYGAENNTAAENSAFKRLQEMSILQGYEDGSYKVENRITRAEFFSVLNKVSKVSQSGTVTFSDVEPGQWYEEAISLAVAAGYASGYGDSTFRPEANITRAEAAAAMCKAFGGDIEKRYNFTDRDTIPAWAVDYVDTMVSGGYLTHYSDGSFKGGEYITRGEVAVMLDRFVGEIYADKEDVENKTFGKNLIIGTTDITFKNTVFEGDIYIGAGVSGGEVKFVDCKIAGTVHMAGRNDAAVFFENTDCKKVCVNSTGTANVITSGSSVIDVLVTRSECGIMEMNADKGVKTVTAYSDAEIFGDFEDVVVENNAKVNKVGSSNIKRSYTLARYYSGDFKSDPIVGGSRTELQTDKEYLLKDLTTVPAGRLVPAFSPETTEYRLLVPASAGSVRFLPVADGTSECRILGKNVDDGYNTEISANQEKTVQIDLYNELVKRNTYTVKVMPYGTDNTDIFDISATGATYKSVKSEDGTAYTFTLTGEDDGSPLSMTVNVDTVDPDSTVKIGDSPAGKSATVTLTEKVTNIPIKVTSSDSTANKDYTLTLVRENMPAMPYTQTVTSDANAVHAVSVTYMANETAAAGTKEMTLTVENGDKNDEYKCALPALTKDAVATAVFYARLYPGDNTLTVAANEAFTVTGVTAESKAVAIYQAEDYATAVDQNGAAKSATSLKDADGKEVGKIFWGNSKITYNMVYPAGKYNIKVRWATTWGKTLNLDIKDTDGNTLLPSLVGKTHPVYLTTTPNDSHYQEVDFGTFDLDEPFNIVIDALAGNIGVDYIKITDVTQ